MGLNLSRRSFADWLENFGSDSRKAFIKKLEGHVGKKLSVKSWSITDSAYPRVGSYTSYGIFCLCLYFITKGDFEDQLEPDEDLEREALNCFRKTLTRTPKSIRYSSHFLDSNDADTIFIPELFAKPFHYDEWCIASLPRATEVLAGFAKVVDFDIDGNFDEEHVGKKETWQPINTAKNVARILHKFFKEKPSACVFFS